MARKAYWNKHKVLKGKVFDSPHEMYGRFSRQPPTARHQRRLEKKARKGVKHG